MSKRPIPPISKLYAQVSKNVLNPNTSFTYELWYSRLIGRRLSIYFTWLFLHTSLTPNAVTVISLFPALIGVGLMAYPTTSALVWGFILFNLYIIIDSSDGEMARYYKKMSSFGHYMDGILHVLIYSGLYISLGTNVYLRTSNAWYLILGLVTALAYAISSFIFHTDPELERGNNYLKLRKKDSKLMYLMINIYNFITGDLNIFLFLFIAGPLQYLGYIKIDLFMWILWINFVLALGGGVIFQMVKKYKDNN